MSIFKRCDVCGKEVVVASGGVIDMKKCHPGERGLDMKHYDICEDCWDKINRMIGSMVAKNCAGTGGSK